MQKRFKFGAHLYRVWGDVIEYFDSDNNKEGYSLNSQDISIKKYKIMLWKAVRDVLEIAGFDIESTEHELIIGNKNMATKQSLPVAWLDKLSTKN